MQSDCDPWVSGPAKNGFPMRFESKLSVRSPGLPPQSPCRSRSAYSFLPESVWVVTFFVLLSGIPAPLIHAACVPSSSVPAPQDSESQAPPVVSPEPSPEKEVSPKETPVDGAETPKADALTEQIEGWISQLGSTDWEQREEAAAQLKNQGQRARAALQKALKDSDPEIVSQAEELLAAIESPVIRETGRRDSGSGTRRRIISGPGGIVTLELGGDPARRRKVEIDPIPTEADEAREEILKEIRDIEKQMEREFQRGFGRGRIPIPDMEDLFDIPTVGGIRWQGSTTLGGQSSRNEYRNGQLSLSIETRYDQITIEPMGLVLETVHPVLKVHLPLAAEAGYLIKTVRPGSPAEAAGLRQWDLLLRDGDLKLRNENELAAAFRMPRPDRSLEVIRQGQKILLPKTEKVPVKQDKK